MTTTARGPRLPTLRKLPVSLEHPRRKRHEGTALAEAVVDCAVYSGGERIGGRVPLHEAVEAAAGHEDGFVWIGLFQPSAACLQQVAREFDLHPLAVEDAVTAHQRPKIEQFGDALFVVLKTVRYVDSAEVIETGELMLFVGPRYVVSVRHGEASDLGDVRADLEARPASLVHGPQSVLHAVLDRVVDGYQPAAEAVEDDVDEIELAVFSPGRSQPTERIYKLKREVLEFRRAVDPLRPVTERLSQADLPGLTPTAAAWFRDVHDHVERAVEVVGSLDTLLDSALSASLAQVSMQQNDDMRRISAWVAIAGANTLLAGIYGMNFDNMPELRWEYGYYLVLAVMALVSVALYRGFKANDWL